MPSSNRPPDAWLRVTACFANTAGSRNMSQSTKCPTLSREVWAAIQVAVAIASNIGTCSAAGGAKWSIIAIPENPARSAPTARSTISAIDIRICGSWAVRDEGAGRRGRGSGGSGGQAAQAGQGDAVVDRGAGAG